ncbi:hypothetical protein EAH73_09030 [Hymenobacter nivis]|uniref:Uncharacterized protein n=1 Tax=Hymenobacter nivis TaxID=1850093 RepID=A0A502GZL4_9BACT|nr:hypothetical protein EAH73_09030 [Hymenobacter nivis]
MGAAVAKQAYYSLKSPDTLPGLVVIHLYPPTGCPSTGYRPLACAASAWPGAAPAPGATPRVAPAPCAPAVAALRWGYR